MQYNRTQHTHTRSHIIPLGARWLCSCLIVHWLRHRGGCNMCNGIQSPYKDSERHRSACFPDALQSPFSARAARITVMWTWGLHTLTAAEITSSLVIYSPAAPRDCAGFGQCVGQAHIRCEAEAHHSVCHRPAYEQVLLCLSRKWIMRRTII